VSIFDAYRRIDDFVLEQTNELVKGWNWTTGRTRADLATLCFAGNMGSFILAANMGCVERVC
jgi:hypothetical protein